MTTEYTVAIIKPDAVRNGHASAILRKAEAAGLTVAALHVDTLTADQAMALYGEHEGKPFYDSLIEFTVSGRCVCAILEGDDAIAKWRKLLGATDPAKAEKGTIRHSFGTGGPANAAHGSDSAESALREAEILNLRRRMTASDMDHQMRLSTLAAMHSLATHPEPATLVSPSTPMPAPPPRRPNTMVVPQTPPPPPPADPPKLVSVDVVHALLTPWPISAGVLTWCGMAADKAGPNHSIGFKPEVVNCPRCQSSMTTALATLHNWVPFFRRPPTGGDREESREDRQP